MPIARFEMPDGRIARFEVPDGVTPEQATSMIEQELGLVEVAPEQPEQDAQATNYPGEGVVMGITDPVYGLGQMIPRALEKLTYVAGQPAKEGSPAAALGEAYKKSYQGIDKAVQQREADYQADRGPDAGFDGQRLIGNIISPVNALGSGVAVRAAQAPTFLGKVAGGAAVGAGYGSSAPVTDTENFAKEKAAQVGVGAAGGAVAPAVGAAVGRVLNPQTDDAVKKMLKEGVKLTPGEIAGGTLKRGEDLLESVPGVGGLVKGAKKRSIESLNTAAINRSLAPIGKKLPKELKSGRGAIEIAENALGEAYEKLMPKLTGKIDNEFANDLRNISGMVDVDDIMNAAEKQKFKSIIGNSIIKRIAKNGGITGQAIKEIESELGEKAATFGRGSIQEQQLADSLREVQSSIRKMLERTNPDYADELRKINKGWANFKRVQKASASVGAVDGIFTPAQLQSAVKAGDRSKDKAAFSKGKALMQDLSDPARSIMAQTVPNSGSVDRALAAGLPIGLASGAKLNPFLAVPALASLAYIPGGRRVAQAVLAERPDLLRRLGTTTAQYSPYLSAPFALPLAVQQGNNIPPKENAKKRP